MAVVSSTRLVATISRSTKITGSNMTLASVADGKTIDYDEYHQFKVKVEAYVVGGQRGVEWITINVAYDEALLEAIDDTFSLLDLPQNE